MLAMPLAVSHLGGSRRITSVTVRGNTAIAVAQIRPYGNRNLIECRATFARGKREWLLLDDSGCMGFVRDDYPEYTGWELIVYVTQAAVEAFAR